jgi:hypothetical protein
MSISERSCTLTRRLHCWPRPAACGQRASVGSAGGTCVAQEPIASKPAPLLRFGQCARCGGGCLPAQCVWLPESPIGQGHANAPARQSRIASGCLSHARQSGEGVASHFFEQIFGASRIPAHRWWRQTNAIRAQGLPPCAGRNFPSAANTAKHTPLNPRSSRATRQRRRPTSLRSHPPAAQTVRIMGRCVEGVHRAQSTPPKQCFDGCVDESGKRPPIQWTRGSASRRSRFLQAARVQGRPMTFHAGRSGHGMQTSHGAYCCEGPDSGSPIGRSELARGCNRRLRCETS